jgi:hypothetical protein
MLISTTDERWSQGEKIDFYLQGVCAIDPDTGAEMYASDGRRKAGRGTRYICRVPTGETRMGYLGSGNPRPVAIKRKAFTVTAHSDRLAIEQANKALARFLGKNPRWDDQAWNWVFDQPSAAALLRGE